MKRSCDDPSTSEPRKRASPSPAVSASASPQNASTISQIRELPPVVDDTIRKNSSTPVVPTPSPAASPTMDNRAVNPDCPPARNSVGVAHSMPRDLKRLPAVTEDVDSKYGRKNINQVFVNAPASPVSLGSGNSSDDERFEQELKKPRYMGEPLDLPNTREAFIEKFWARCILKWRIPLKKWEDLKDGEEMPYYYKKMHELNYHADVSCMFEETAKPSWPEVATYPTVLKELVRESPFLFDNPHFFATKQQRPTKYPDCAYSTDVSWQSEIDCKVTKYLEGRINTEHEFDVLDDLWQQWRACELYELRQFYMVSHLMEQWKREESQLQLQIYKAQCAFDDSMKDFGEQKYASKVRNRQLVKADVLMNTNPIEVGHQVEVFGMTGKDAWMNGSRACVMDVSANSEDGKCELWFDSVENSIRILRDWVNETHKTNRGRMTKQNLGNFVGRRVEHFREFFYNQDKADSFAVQTVLNYSDDPTGEVHNDWTDTKNQPVKLREFVVDIGRTGCKFPLVDLLKNRPTYFRLENEIMGEEMMIVKAAVDDNQQYIDWYQKHEGADRRRSIVPIKNVMRAYNEPEFLEKMRNERKEKDGKHVQFWDANKNKPASSITVKRQAKRYGIDLTDRVTAYHLHMLQTSLENAGADRSKYDKFVRHERKLRSEQAGIILEMRKEWEAWRTRDTIVNYYDIKAKLPPIKACLSELLEHQEYIRDRLEFIQRSQSAVAMRLLSCGHNATIIPPSVPDDISATINEIENIVREENKHWYSMKEKKTTRSDQLHMLDVEKVKHWTGLQMYVDHPELVNTVDYTKASAQTTQEAQNV